MKRLLAFATALALTWLLSCASPPERQALPVPPQQNVPWKTPAIAYPKLASAAEALAALGLPDPRGCEYREVELSGPFGLAGQSATRAWVLPASRRDRTRWAILWNGLISRVLEVGPKADLRSEIDSLLAADRKVLGEGARPELRLGYESAFFWVEPE